MISAGERPDVSFEIGKELDDDLVGGLRDEIPLGHFEFVFRKGTGAREELVAGAGGQDDEVGFARLSVDGIAGFVESRVDLVDAVRMNAATGGAGAIEEQAVENAARVDDDGMFKIEMRAMILGADDFDVANQFFRVIVVEEERVALRGLVGEAAATGFLPVKVLVVNIDGMAGQSELLAAHCAGGTATYNYIVSHRSSTKSFVYSSGVGRKVRVGKRFSCNGKKHQTEPCKQYSTENSSGCGGTREAAYQMNTCTSEQEEGGEVGGQKDEQDFATFQEQNTEGERKPTENDEREPEGVTRAPRRGRSGKDFQSVQKKERGDDKQRKSHPALQREPRGSGGEFEPAGDQEVEKKAGERRAGKDAGGDGSQFASDAEVQKNDGETQEQKKARQVVAFEKVNRLERFEVRPKVYKEKGKKNHGESGAPARYGRNGGKVPGGVVTDQLMEQRSPEQQDATKAEEAGDEIEPVGEAGLAGQPQDVGGPSLRFANGGRREKNRDVGRPGQDDILDRRVIGRNQVGGIGL